MIDARCKSWFKKLCLAFPIEDYTVDSITCSLLEQRYIWYYYAGYQGKFLDMGARLDIAIDLAHAITYLHMYAGIWLCLLYIYLMLRNLPLILISILFLRSRQMAYWFFIKQIKQYVQYKDSKFTSVRLAKSLIIEFRNLNFKKNYHINFM
jgi:hypothetical protein